MKWIIFDLDGTLADIEVRRDVCTKENGKMDWDKFFDPENINLDEPNQPVINTLKVGQVVEINQAKHRGQKFIIKKVKRTKCIIQAKDNMMETYNCPISMLIA